MKGLCKSCRYYEPENLKWHCDTAFTIQNIEDRDDIEVNVTKCIEYKKSG